jgi:hypothetical protein
MSHIPKVTLVTIGLIAVILGGLGLSSGFSSLMVDYSKLGAYELPYFYWAFYLMSGICLLCNLALIGCGFQFLRGRVSAVPLFTGVLVFECVYFLGLGLAWAMLSHHLSVGLSVAAATGVGNNGLNYQIYIIFPLWGWIGPCWAKRRLVETLAS